MTFKAVIPARFASSRLPGKPLLKIGGRAMVVRVAEQARAAGAEEVIVATDDERICRVVEDSGHRAVVTDAGHACGAERVGEVAASEAWPEATIVLNVQGDEPLAPPALMRQLAEALAADALLEMATLCEPIRRRRDLQDPNVVKVVRGKGGFALYFSRSPVPMARDGYPRELGGLWRRHVGIYAFRAGALRRMAALPPSPLEAVERLEQLRALENGLDILVLDACCAAPGGVDTPADLARVRRLVRNLRR